MNTTKIYSAIGIIIVIVGIIFGLLLNTKKYKPTQTETKRTISTTSSLPTREAVAEPDIPSEWGVEFAPAGSDGPYAEEDVREYLTKSTKTHLVLSKIMDVPTDRFIMAWAECAPGEKKTDYCFGYIGLFDNDWHLIQKQTLPHTLRGWSNEGISFTDESLGLYDVNGDGRKDFILTYYVSEYPRAAVGSRFEHKIAVYDSYNLNLLWQANLANGSQADTEPRCDSNFRYFANGCQNTANIQETDTCATMSYCIDNPDDACGVKPVTTAGHLFVWSEKNNTFTELKNVPVTCKDQA